MTPPTLEQQLAELEVSVAQAKAGFAAMGSAAQKATESFAAFGEKFALLAEPEVEPESVPAGLEPPGPVAEVAAGRLQEAAVGPERPIPSQWPSEWENGAELVEMAWSDEAHPRWPAGTPGGLGGQFMHVGQRFSWKGVQYDIDQVLPGGVYAHVASLGDPKKAAYVWIPAAKKKDGKYEVQGVSRPPAEAIYGAKSASTMQTGKFTATVVDPYVQDDHDPTIPIPPEAPPELTPERWLRFGRADQLRYTDLMKQFGKWSPGKAQSLVDSQLAKQPSKIVEFVKAAYSSQFGSSSAFTIGFHQIYAHLLGSSDTVALEQARKKYEACKETQDAAARAIQWDLYNRLKSPDVAIFHKSGDGPGWWNSNILSGQSPAFSGVSQSQKYHPGGWFGNTVVLSPIAIRSIIMATTSADIYKGHSFKGEQEVSIGDPIRLDANRTYVSTDPGLGAAGSWLSKITSHGADGTIVQQLRDYFDHGGDLPIPPEPANIQTLGAGGVQTWVSPPVEATQGIGAFKYANVDANGAPQALPANTLDLKPGDYIEGMQGTRYIIIEDKGDPFGVRYFKVTDTGEAQPDGSYKGHKDWTVEESYSFEGQGVKPFKKLLGHADLPEQAEQAKTGFVAHAWSETAADAGKFVSKLEPGTKFVVSGIPYEIQAHLGGGQTKIENLDSGGLAQINGTYKTPWLVLKEGYTEEGVPAFKPEDYFEHPSAPLAELDLKPGDVFYMGKEGQTVWQVGPEGMVKGQLHVVGLSGQNQGKLKQFDGTQTGRLLEPKPVGWQPAQVGDTLAIDGKKAEVTKLLANGVVQVNLKPGVLKLKPDDYRLAGLFHAAGYEKGEKLKLKDFGVGEKFHGGSGGNMRPYVVLEQDVPRGKGKPKGVRVRNLDTGGESVLPNTRKYQRLNPKHTGALEPGAPVTAPVDHGKVFNPDAWKVGGWIPSTEFVVGTKFKSGPAYHEVVADKGSAWETKNLLDGSMGVVTKTPQEFEGLEPSGTVPVTAFDPDAYTVGKPKKLSQLAVGDIFQGTKKGKHYVVKTTGAKSGLSAMDLETGKVSSPWSYDKVAPVLIPKSNVVKGDTEGALQEGDVVHLKNLKVGDQFLHSGQPLEVVEAYTSESKNITAAPVGEDGGLGFPSKVGHYPGLLVTFHEKAPPPEPEKLVPEAPAPAAPAGPIDTAGLPSFVDAEGFSPKSKTGGGYTFTKAKNAAPGTILKGKDGQLYKVVDSQADPVVSDGDVLGTLPGELNMKVVEEPFDDHTVPAAGPEVAAPTEQTPVGQSPAGSLPALQAVAAAKSGPENWADNATVKLELDGLHSGDLWKSTANSPTLVALGPVPGDDNLFYSQNLETGEIITHGKKGVPDLVSPMNLAKGPLFEPTYFEGWESAGKKNVSDLEPGDYYAAMGGDELGGPAVQVLENKGGGNLVVRAVNETAMGEYDPGDPGGTPDPYEIKNLAGLVEVYEPIPQGGAVAGGKVPAGGLPVGAQFETGALFGGTPAGTYEVVAWADVPEPVGAAMKKYDLPEKPGGAAESVTSVVWVKNVSTGEFNWVGDELQVQPVAAAAPGAPSSDLDAYDEAGNAMLSDLKPGDFFKSAKGVVWQVGEPGSSASDTPIVKVTTLQSGITTDASPSMPVVKLTPKHIVGVVLPAPGPAPGPDLTPTVQPVELTAKEWTPEVGAKFASDGHNWTVTKVGVASATSFHAEPEHGGSEQVFSGKTKVLPTPTPRPYDPNEWEFAGDVPAHELTPGQKFSLHGKPYVVNSGHPPEALGDKLAGDPDHGWVTNLEDGKSVAYKNTPGGSGDTKLSILQPKPGAGPEVAAPGTLAGNPDFLVPNENGVTIADLDIGDHFLSGDYVWQIASVSHSTNMVTAVKVGEPATEGEFHGGFEPAEVPQGKTGGYTTYQPGQEIDDLFGPPPPGEDLVPNTAANPLGMVTLADLSPGDHAEFDGEMWEVVGQGGYNQTSTVKNLATGHVHEGYPSTTVPDQVPAYKVGAQSAQGPSIAVLSSEFFAKGPLPDNTVQAALKDLPAGTLVQMKPDEGLASGPAEKAVWRIVGTQPAGMVQLQIVVPAAGGYEPGHLHSVSPHEVFDRILTPQHKAMADALDVPWALPQAEAEKPEYLGSMGPHHVPGSPAGMISKFNQGDMVKVSDLKKGDKFGDGQGGWYELTSKKGAKQVEVKQLAVGMQPVQPTPDYAPAFVPPGAKPKGGAPSSGPIEVPQNTAGLMLSELPVGALVQKNKVTGSALDAGETPAVWKVTEGHGLEIVQPLLGGDPSGANPIGHKHPNPDPNEVWDKALMPGEMATGAGEYLIQSLEPGDHFLKGGVVYQVEGPAPNLEGSHIRANSVSPVGVTPGAVDTVDYPNDTLVVKVPSPAGGDPVYSAGEQMFSVEGEPLIKGQTVWSVKTGQAVIPKGSGNAPGTVSTVPADSPGGAYLTFLPGTLTVHPPKKHPAPFEHAALGTQVPHTAFAAGDLVVIQPGGGASMVGKTGMIVGFSNQWIDVEFSPGGTFENGGLGRFIESHLQLAPPAGAGDLPPLKDYKDFALGDEAWTLGGKHGHFESPESGPAAFEKVFLIDGDPTPHQEIGMLYTADPMGGPPAGPEVAAPGEGFTVGDTVSWTTGHTWEGPVKTGTVIGFEAGGTNVKVHVEGPDESPFYVVAASKLTKDEPFRPPDELPDNTGEIPLSGLEPGTLVQAVDPINIAAIWKVLGPGEFDQVQLEVVAPMKDPSSGEPTPGAVPVGAKNEWEGHYVFEKILTPDEQHPPIVYTVQDAALVKQLVDAEASGDEQAVEVAESFILNKLGITEPGAGVGLKDFADFLKGVSVQFGIDLGGAAKTTGFPLEGGKVGDKVELGGKTYKITSVEGDLFQVSDDATGEPAGAISKQNVAGTLVPYPGQFLSSLEKGDHFVLDGHQYEVLNPTKFLNDAPITDVAVKDIHSGEKATFDYGTVVDKVKDNLQTLDTLEVGDHFEVEVKDGVGEFVVTKTEGAGKLVYAKPATGKGAALPFGWSIVVKKLPAKATADEEAGTGLSSEDILKPYSAKSKSGGGYFFSDLDNMAQGAEFIDKTGATYVVHGKSSDGYYVRFHKKGAPDTLYQAPAGSRVKLPS